MIIKKKKCNGYLHLSKELMLLDKIKMQLDPNTGYYQF